MLLRGCREGYKTSDGTRASIALIRWQYAYLIGFLEKSVRAAKFNVVALYPSSYRFFVLTPWSGNRCRHSLLIAIRIQATNAAMVRSPNAVLDAEGFSDVVGSALTIPFSFSCCGRLLGAEPRSWFVDAPGLMSSFRCQPTWCFHSSRTPRSSGGLSSSTSFTKAMPSSWDSIMIGLLNLEKSFFEACCAFIHYQCCYRKFCGWSSLICSHLCTSVWRSTPRKWRENWNRKKLEKMNRRPTVADNISHHEKTNWSPFTETY